MSKLPVATLALAVVLVQSLAVTPASAAPQRRSSSRPPTRSIKIAVLAKEGSKESRARNVVIRALRANRVQIASTRETASAKAAYQQGRLSDREVMSLSEQYRIAAVALVKVSGRKSVTVTFRSGEDGTVLDEAQWSKFSRSRLKSVIAQAKVHQTSREPTPPPAPLPVAETPTPPSPPVAEATPPAEPPKEPDSTRVVPPTPPAVAESPAAPSSIAARPPEPPTSQVATATPSEDPQRLIFDLAVGGGAFSRDFSYSADATALGSYKMNIGQMVTGTLQWYPLAPATSSALGWIGLIGSGDYGLGLKSSTPNGPSPTSYRYSGGLKFRVPIGNSELGLSGSYGRATFSINTQNQASGTALPDVLYEFVQPELSARLGIFRSFWLVAGANYLHALKSGQIASTAYFPHATARGLGGSFGFAWELVSSLELRVIAEYERVTLTMNSRATDPFRAQSATDQYLLGRGTIAYRWK